MKKRYMKLDLEMLTADELVWLDFFRHFFDMPDSFLVAHMVKCFIGTFESVVPREQLPPDYANRLSKNCDICPPF